MASGEACGGETRVREREWVWDRRREGKEVGKRDGKGHKGGREG